MQAKLISAGPIKPTGWRGCCDGHAPAQYECSIGHTPASGICIDGLLP